MFNDIGSMGWAIIIVLVIWLITVLVLYSSEMKKSYLEGYRRGIRESGEDLSFAVQNYKKIYTKPVFLFGNDQTISKCYFKIMDSIEQYCLSIEPPTLGVQFPKI